LQSCCEINYKESQNYFWITKITIVLTGTQIRMARAALNWSGQVLAEKAGLSYGAIQKAEAFDSLPNMLAKSLVAVKTALEKGGVCFIDADSGGGPGVRLRIKRAKKRSHASY
jgi:hypothetical protein